MTDSFLSEMERSYLHAAIVNDQIHVDCISMIFLYNFFQGVEMCCCYLCTLYIYTLIKLYPKSPQQMLLYLDVCKKKI